MTLRNIYRFLLPRCLIPNRQFFEICPIPVLVTGYLLVIILFLKKFTHPDFLGLRHLVATQTMVSPNFDSCPAAKAQWVFDCRGAIHSCPAARSREEFQLGTFLSGSFAEPGTD